MTLTSIDARIIKGMLKRGDKQHDIAAYFGVNGGRIAEIATGERFLSELPRSRGLPKPGPYAFRSLQNSHYDLLNNIRDLLAAHRVDDAMVCLDNALDEIGE